MADESSSDLSSSDWESEDDTMLSGVVSFSNGVQPYKFEPRRTETVKSSTDSESATAESESESNCAVNNDDVNTDRTNDISVSWCNCGCCRLLPTFDECYCCREFSNSAHKMEGEKGEVYRCITENPRVASIVLDREALIVAGLTMSTAYGTKFPKPTSDE